MRRRCDSVWNRGSSSCDTSRLVSSRTILPCSSLPQCQCWGQRIGNTLLGMLSELGEQQPNKKVRMDVRRLNGQQRLGRRTQYRLIERDEMLV